MGVELGEVELPGDEEEDGADGLEAAVASGAALGGLEQPVEGLDESVGAACSGPGSDPMDVLSDHPGDGLHGIDHYLERFTLAPLVEHGPDYVDLLAVEDLPQLLSRYIQAWAVRLPTTLARSASRSARRAGPRLPGFLSSVHRRPLKSGSLLCSTAGSRRSPWRRGRLHGTC